MQYFRSLGGNFRYENSEFDDTVSESTDTETEEDDEELWNPIEIIDQIKKAETREEKLKYKRVLLEKFLDQKNPIVASQMKEFLNEEGVMETCIAFITRLDEPKSPENLEGSNKRKLRPVVTPETEAAVKRSFRLMKIFLSPTKEFDNLITQKLSIIVKELFRIFEVPSTGNFHHFKAILEQLLVSRPIETTKIILGDELYVPMLDFLYEPAVADAAISFLSCEFRSPADAVRFYTEINESQALSLIANKIAGKGQSDAQYAGEFFLRVIDRLCHSEPPAVMFGGLARNSKFLDKLFAALTSRDEAFTMDQKKACASVIRELLIRGNPEYQHSTNEFQRHPGNALAAVNHKLHDYAIRYVGPLCDELIQLDVQSRSSTEEPVLFSAFTVQKPFGINRLILCEILSDLITSIPSCLNELPAPIWRVLSGWFLEYSHNNVYHCYFWRIVKTVFLNHHEESIKTLLSKYKFLTAMIRAYSDPQKTAIRGFAIQIGNLIRLACDLEPPTGYLRNFLGSHDLWKTWVGPLREETEKQLKPALEPTRKYLKSFSSSDTGIDLGSNYARTLGFTQTAPAPETTPVKPAGASVNKPTTNQSPNNAKPADSPATPSPAPGSGGKKKKKKKNKKKKSLETSTDTADMADSEDSEELSDNAADASSKSPNSNREKDPNSTELESEDNKKDSSSLGWWNDMKKELQNSNQ